MHLILKVEPPVEYVKFDEENCSSSSRIYYIHCHRAIHVNFSILLRGHSQETRDQAKPMLSVLDTVINECME